MKKQLIFTAILTISFTVLNSAAFAYSTRETTTVPYLVSSTQSPQTRWSNVRHTFRIQIPETSSAVSQVKVILSPGVTVKNDITVHERSGKEIATNSNVGDDAVIINFTEPLKSTNEIEIDMNKVILSRLHRNPWSYRIKTKLADTETELDLGVAQIRNFQR
ncbi:hypothetical protein C7B62_20270 [Pleurocapsa sp. CCALA 161]|uniref:DUF2808 domain-containing protein n=1 Tax=Pleurocapsa sp. CCALA 161 TaxID=2107688 RepID=UPI000D060579|nr:DUF2808 domain-containing protein [Pleurocapsa sp. CCALA 161]PSB07324.1 hypothetical protein C7B62_20270 [Pleurocapsa sp. CCALA 161]